MVYAERGNKVVSISEDAVQRYVEQGFTIKNASGEVIKDCVPTDMAALKKAYADDRAEIKALKEEIAKLKAQLVEKTTQKAQKEKVVEVATENNSVEIEKPVSEKPKRATKSNTAKAE